MKTIHTTEMQLVQCWKDNEEVTLPLIKITPAELDTMVLEHANGGYGWAMVEDIDREYCRVAPVSKGDLQMRCYLTWKPRLKVGYLVDPITSQSKAQPLSPQALSLARQLRQDIKSGKRRVEAAYIL